MPASTLLSTEASFKMQILLWGWAITTPPELPTWALRSRSDIGTLAVERSGLDTVEMGLWDRDAAWLASTEFWVEGKRVPSPYRWCLAGSPAQFERAA